MLKVTHLISGGAVQNSSGFASEPRCWDSGHHSHYLYFGLIALCFYSCNAWEPVCVVGVCLLTLSPPAALRLGASMFGKTLVSSHFESYYLH